MLKIFILIVVYLAVFVSAASGQKKSSDTEVKPPAQRTSKKANERPAVKSSKAALSEPFDKADIKTMESQCVKLETEAGDIELEMFPEIAPE